MHLVAILALKLQYKVIQKVIWIEKNDGAVFVEQLNK